MATTRTEWQPSADPKNLRLSPEEATQLLDTINGLPLDNSRTRHVKRAEEAADFLRQDQLNLIDHIESQGRDMTANEYRQATKADQAIATLDRGLTKLSQTFDMYPGMSGDDEDAYAEGKPLAKGQSFAGYVRSRGIRAGAEDVSEGIDADKYLRGVLFNQWKGADRELQIANTMSGASSTAGGALIPTVLQGQIIDMARAKTRVLEAGAQLVPMESRTVDVPTWTQDPTLSWRAENDIVSESDAAVSKVTLVAKPLATVVRVSRELIEDTDIRSALANAFAAAFALKIDQAALYADGSAGAPTGVKSTAAVTKTSMGTNGASMTDWGNMMDAVGRCRDNNEYPNAQIMADRSARVLAKLRASAGAGDYLTPPEYLSEVARLTTSGVPINLTVGTSSDCSDVFTADWSQLLIGVRTGLTISVLEERYMTNDAAGSPKGGQYGFMCWWRGDIALARAKAFDVITGVRG